MKTLKYIFALMLAAVALAAAAERPTLKFNGERFKIMQLTDLHITDDAKHPTIKDSTYALVRKMISDEHPDLVIMTGDVVWNTSDALPLWKEITAVFEETKTPFAVTFGNHDEETNLDNADILRFLESCDMNLTRDDALLSGSGNCSLPVLDSRGIAPAGVLYLFDSHSKNKSLPFTHYDWIRHDQIDWYRAASDRYTAANGGITLPSMAFFHIPLMEYESMRRDFPGVGNALEAVCCPRVNSGLLESFLEKGDVLAVMAGHDHNNDYLIDVAGQIMLAYGRKTGFNSAYKELLPRGCRIITLHENGRAFDTYILDTTGRHFPYFFSQRTSNP